jgi:hypothetical protein
MRKIELEKENKMILDTFLKADARELFMNTMDSTMCIDENGRKGYGFEINEVEKYLRRKLKYIVPRKRIVQALGSIKKEKWFVLYSED